MNQRVESLMKIRSQESVNLLLGDICESRLNTYQPNECTTVLPPCILRETNFGARVGNEADSQNAREGECRGEREDRFFCGHFEVSSSVLRLG